MFKHTIAALKIISEEITSIAHVAKIVIPSMMSLYLIAMCVMNIGFFWLNVTMLALTLAGLTVYLITSAKSTGKSKKFNKRMASALRFTKMGVNLISLILTVYILTLGTGEVDTLKLVTVPIVVIMLVVQFALEVISIYISEKFELLEDGIEMDFELMFKITDAKRAIADKLVGKEHDRSGIVVSEKNRNKLSLRAKSETQKKRERFKSYWKEVFSKRDMADED